MDAIYGVYNCLFKLQELITMDLNEMAESIREQINGIQKKINDLTKQKGNDRQESANKIQKRLNGAKNLLNHYKFAIDEAIDQDGVDSHKSQHKQFEHKYEKLKKKLDYTRNQHVNENDLFKHRKVQEEAEDMSNRQAVIQKGHQVQKESKDAVLRIKQGVNKMEEQANEIGIQLDRQIKQLDSIYDNMKDTETTLKRAEVHLRYFARQVYTDRLMICLIIVIILAIITIIILKIVGKTPDVQIDQLT